jgi:hypothetical protein
VQFGIVLSLTWCAIVIPRTTPLRSESLSRAKSTGREWRASFFKMHDFTFSPEKKI